MYLLSKPHGGNKTTSLQIDTIYTIYIYKTHVWPAQERRVHRKVKVLKAHNLRLFRVHSERRAKKRLKMFYETTRWQPCEASWSHDYCTAILFCIPMYHIYLHTPRKIMCIETYRDAAISGVSRPPSCCMCDGCLVRTWLVRYIAHDNDYLPLTENSRGPSSHARTPGARQLVFREKKAI